MPTLLTFNGMQRQGMKFYSGSSAPSGTDEEKRRTIWYDTVNNLMKIYYGSTQSWHSINTYQ